MREILFRGKRIDDGEWVEGHYHCTDYIWQGEEVRRHYILQQNYGDADVVDQSTVGQYTGLTDKNGKKIFEGDIIRAIASNIAGDDIEATATVVFDDYELMWDIEHSHEIEIIGNIHDNPELLEVTDNA